MVLPVLFSTLLAWLSFNGAAQAKLPDDVDHFEHFCGQVWLEKKHKLKFNKMERRLVCGDSKDDDIGKPWATIPANQAAYFLRSFLQSRGYHQPEFNYHATEVYVRKGPVSKLTNFKLNAIPKDWRPPKKRAIRGRLLTPQLLNELEGWTINQLKNFGYACAEAKAQADPTTGEVVVNTQPGRQELLLGIEDLNEIGLDSRVLSRYHAFYIHDLYNQQLVDLTKRRIIEDGVLQSIDLRPQCRPDGVVLLRSVDPGKSRKLSIGIGGSTEEGPKFRMLIRQARIGSLASSAQGNLSLSFRDQEIGASARYYYTTHFVNSYLEPYFSFGRSEEVKYTATILDARILHGWGLGFRKHAFSLRAGPEHIRVDQTKGFGPAHSDANLISVFLNWQSYDWEFWKTSPRSGFNFSIDTFRAQKQLANKWNAQKVLAQGQTVYNLGNFDPPLLVAAFRGKIGTVIATDENEARLPLQFQFYGGGSGDLRGYDRVSLPWGRNYASSLMTYGLELRAYKGIYHTVDPFIFYDIGKFGGVNMNFDSPIFTSPGFGLRWESFIGTLRGYIAQPIVYNKSQAEESHKRSTYYGVTLGEEF